MSIIVWIIIGGLAGWIASKFMGTDAQMGVLANIIVGVIGAFLGGWVLNLFGMNPMANGGGMIAGFVTALIGACLLLFILKLVTGRRSHV